MAAHVGERAGAVGDVRERDERDIAGRAGRGDLVRLRPVDRVALEHSQLGVAARRDALEHVAVGREVVPVRHHRAPPRPRPERRAHELVEVDRRRVAGEHLARPCAEHRLGEQVARAHRRVDPVVPAADELALPRLEHGLQAAGGRDRHAPERVAVEVDAGGVAVREAIPERGERVRPVERGGALRPVGHRGSVRPLRLRSRHDDVLRVSWCSPRLARAPPSARRERRPRRRRSARSRPARRR